MKKSGLGKGIDALFSENVFVPENSGENVLSGVKTVRLSDVEPNRNQPRKNFDEEKLQELAESIKEYGVISPLIVSEMEGGRYRIIAGERRWRASRIAGISEVPVIIKEYTEKEIMEIALIENLQREDLNIIEVARGYKQLIDEYSLTQEKLAERMGKSRSAVANVMRILSLPKEILDLLEEDKLSFGHARALVALEDKDLAIKIANLAVEKGLSVREIEKLASAKEKVFVEKKEDLHLKALEDKISKDLGRKIKISKGKNKGKIEIEYYSDDDLENIIKMLTM
ncbi:MAG: ParB/RepB/Spo0J family partition protein [Clostridia bacterium]|nr:ParB/RepB/Spo0J family partition protein [Clostridia bacterium]